MATASTQAFVVGDIKITYLPDGEGHFVTAAFMPTSSEEGWALHQQWLDDERRVVTTFGGFLIETGDRKVAVDLGFGDASVEFPGFGTLAGGRYLDSLKQTGVAPGEIDTVVYTHLHIDHTGWTAPGGNLTFANARHLAGSGEWDHWQQPDESGAGPVPDTVAALGSRVEGSADGDTRRAGPGRARAIRLLGTGDRESEGGEVQCSEERLSSSPWDFCRFRRSHAPKRPMAARIAPGCSTSWARPGSRRIQRPERW